MPSPSATPFRTSSADANVSPSLTLILLATSPPTLFVVLTLNIQKRHVIGHNLGMADAAFAEHAGEARLGETVPLVGDDILQFAGICQLVVDGLDAWLAGGQAPPTPNDRSIGPLAPPVAKGSVVLKIGELGPLAVRIGSWISEQSAKGFDDFIPEKDLVEAFLESSIDELAFAVAELESDGYLKTTSFISQRLPRMFTTADLFIAFDPHTGKSNPEVDVGDVGRSGAREVRNGYRGPGGIARSHRLAAKTLQPAVRLHGFANR